MRMRQGCWSRCGRTDRGAGGACDPDQGARRREMPGLSNRGSPGDGAPASGTPSRPGPLHAGLTGEHPLDAAQVDSARRRHARRVEQARGVRSPDESPGHRLYLGDEAFVEQVGQGGGSAGDRRQASPRPRSSRHPPATASARTRRCRTPPAAARRLERALNPMRRLAARRPPRRPSPPAPRSAPSHRTRSPTAHAGSSSARRPGGA
jgi:hypothetical protein